MANSYLNKTFSSSGSLTTWTFSAWVKKCKADENGAIFAAYTDGSNHDRIIINSNGTLSWYAYTSGSYVGNKNTNRVFRDINAWYNIVCQWNTTSGTASERMRIWINGVEETSFAAETNPGSSASSNFNNHNRQHIIGSAVGSLSGTAEYFNGYISHAAFVDGQALAPTVFGETDSTSGIWKFKGPSGVTWGTNGVHLKFENSGALGTDSSGNSNTFTVNGNLKQAIDNPSNSYCTMNPLDNYYPGSTFTTGNNSIGTAGSKRSYNTGTLGVSSGKWYWEVKAVSSVTASNGCWIGIASTNATNDGVSSQQTLGYKQYDYGFSSSTGNINTNNSQSSYGSGYGDNDIVGVAMDLDNNKLYFHVNGTYENSGVPTSGSTGTGAVSIQAPSGTLNGVYTPGLGDWWTSGFNVAFNFGNGFFGTTAIASAGSNGNGSLFEYDVPTGYYALNTKNINTYG
jgi:hypothetical protein